MPPFPGFVGPSYTSLSIRAAQERTVNFYVEQIESAYGKAKRVLYPTPGYVTRANASGGVTNLYGGIRALYTSRVNHHAEPGTSEWFEACYAVVGSQLCMLGFVTKDSSPVAYDLGIRYYFYDLGGVEGLGLPIWTYRAETGPELTLVNGVWDGGVYPPPVYAYVLGTGFTYNNVNQLQASYLGFDFRSADGVDALPLYQSIRLNDSLLIQSEANPGLYQRWKVVGPLVPSPAELTPPVYTDNFNRANGALGANWSAQANGITIISNQAKVTYPDVRVTAHWIGGQVGLDQFSEITNIAGQYVGIAVRVTDGGTTYYSWRTGSLFRTISGSQVQLALLPQPAGLLAPGERGRLEVEGTTLRCYKNGVLVYTHTDSGIANGRPGLEFANLGAQQPIGDDWAGGTLPPTKFYVRADYLSGPGVSIPNGSRTQASVEQVGLVAWLAPPWGVGLFFSFTDALGVDATLFNDTAKEGDSIVLYDAAQPANTETHMVTGDKGLHGQGFYLPTTLVASAGASLMGKRLMVQLRSVIPFQDHGLVVWNNPGGDQRAATALAFDWRSDDFINSTLLYQKAKAGDILLLQGVEDPTNSLRYSVTGPAVFNGNRYSIPVSFLSFTGSGGFTDDTRLQVALNEEIGPPAGFEGQPWPAVITDNGDGGRQLVVSSGGYVWVWADPFQPQPEGTGPVKVPDLSNIACVASLDGFIIALDVLEGVLHSSVLFDAMNFPGLAIDQRTSAPDPWRWMIVQNSLLYVMGERTTDVYYNAGLANFPFAKHTGGTIPFGIAAVQSAAVVGNGWMMLSRTAGGLGQVVFVFGQTAEVVSDHALDAAIESYNRDFTIVDAMGESFEILGHVFYLLTFPKANVSWLFDLQSKTWTEIASWDAQGFTAWRPHWHAVYEGRRLIGDRNNVLLYELDHTVATESGDWYLVAPPPAENEWKIATTPIHRQRRAPTLFSENKRIFFNGLELFMETGIGLPGLQSEQIVGWDPKVTLSYSNDGGHTFTQAASKSSAGRAGQYRVRVSWTRLGCARDRVFQLDMSDPVPWRLIDASLDIRPGAGT